jgi:hypothetical protein
VQDSIADAFTVAHANSRIFGDHRRAVDAAVMALLDGHGDMEVAELAGESAQLGWSQARELIGRVHERLGLDYGAMTETDAQEIVLRIAVLEQRSGSRTVRSITAWAHDVIMHGSDSSAVERLVELEDDLEMAEMGHGPVDVSAVLDAFLEETADAVSRWRPPT